MRWLTATGTAPIPYRTAGDPVTARLRVDHVAGKDPSIGWWIIEQDGRMIRQALRVKGPFVDLARVRWSVVDDGR